MSPGATPSPPSRPPLRQRRLEEAGLARADRLRQRFFWMGQNHRRRAAVEPLGRVAGALLSSRAFRRAMQVGLLRETWRQTVPAELARHSDVTGLHGGRLTVRVDDPAVRFVLEREVGPTLLAALRARPEGSRIRELLFESGPLPDGDAAGAPPGFGRVSHP